MQIFVGSFGRRNYGGQRVAACHDKKEGKSINSVTRTPVDKLVKLISLQKPGSYRGPQMFISSGRLYNELLLICYWRDDGLVVSALASRNKVHKRKNDVYLFVLGQKHSSCSTIYRNKKRPVNLPM